MFEATVVTTKGTSGDLYGSHFVLSWITSQFTQPVNLSLSLNHPTSCSLKLGLSFFSWCTFCKATTNTQHCRLDDLFNITGWALDQTCCISQCAKYRKSGIFGYPWEQNPWTDRHETWVWDPTLTSKYGSDQAAWGHSAHVWNITICDCFFLFLFLCLAYRSPQWTNFHDLYIKRRIFAQGSAFWGSRWWSHVMLRVPPSPFCNHRVTAQ